MFILLVQQDKEPESYNFFLYNYKLLIYKSMLKKINT